MDDDLKRRLPDLKRVLHIERPSRQGPHLSSQWRTGLVERLAVAPGAPRSIDDIPEAFRAPKKPPGHGRRQEDDSDE